ncbi:beta-2 adrenergic receptor-like [Patiria miniata]|uniref:G-protein coupled receptors family 1 profile domain-containing protein n=1 Tax=Patiria miniata TaxID=46514 RepID=A0A914A7C5_PATMI|nr:beta-2 adrenergic receptor-like [Patiria miniata]
MNSTTVFPAERHWDGPESLTIFANVLMILVIILIVLLNSFALFVLRRFSTLPDSTKLYMTSLTMADLCIGLFCALPNEIEIANKRWVLGDFLCTLWGIIYPGCLQISFLSLLLLTVDRFIAIVHSLRYHDIMTPRRSKITVALVWAFSLLESAILFGFVTPATVTEETYFICNYVFRDVYQYTAIISLAIPLIIILVIYLYILHVARRQARRISAQQHISCSMEEQNTPQRMSTKSATTVFIITGSVVLCWTPSIILLVLYTQQVILQEAYNVISKAVLFSNSWLNVVIYYWRKKELRQTIHQWAASLCRSQNNH